MGLESQSQGETDLQLKMKYESIIASYSKYKGAKSYSFVTVRIFR